LTIFNVNIYYFTDIEDYPTLEVGKHIVAEGALLIINLYMIILVNNSYHHWVIYCVSQILNVMVEYLKIVKEDYYHWRTDCPDYPMKGRNTMLIFKKKPTHVQPCPKCQKLEDDKGSE
jgi:hypothetical protein